jgi:hypothetical protein
MSVANELTTEVTAFMLKNEGLSSPVDLRQMLLGFHSTLRSLSLEERRRRREKVSSKAPLALRIIPPPNTQ